MEQAFPGTRKISIFGTPLLVPADTVVEAEFLRSSFTGETLTYWDSQAGLVIKAWAVVSLSHANFGKRRVFPCRLSLVDHNKFTTKEVRKFWRPGATYSLEGNKVGKSAKQALKAFSGLGSYLIDCYLKNKTVSHDDIVRYFRRHYTGKAFRLH